MRIPRGSKEYLAIDVTDHLGGLDDLAGTGPKFDIYDSDGNHIVDQAAASNVGMRAYCLVDTGLAGFDPGGDFQLWLDFAVFPEHPRLGPFDFKVLQIP